MLGKMQTIGISKASIRLIFLAALLAYSSAQLKEVASSDKIFKEKPIIIQTQVQTYDQPTLGEYQICHENLDRCLAVCATATNRTACETECPTCPILINQDVVVQGINDTDYRVQPVTGTGNTTTIIRLTNEIRNIIDNNMGNVTALNENNIHVHQNISTSGGKFGLGYNQNGSCCIVVSSSKNCDSRQFSTATRCHHKRHRVCGERCKARVLYAKRVTKCSEPTENEMPTCHQTISYVPYRKTTHRRRRRSHCQYTQQWPFVSCGGDSIQRRPSRAYCKRCYESPYIDILEQRIPRRCMACFSAGGGMNAGYYGYGAGYYGYVEPPCYVTNTCYPVLPVYPAPIYPSLPSRHPTVSGGGDGDGNGNDDFDIEDEEFLPGDGWTVESTKCRLPDGTITSNCHNDEVGSGDGNPSINDNGKKPITDSPLEVLPDSEEAGGIYDDENDNDDEFYIDSKEDDGFPEIVRRRRRAKSSGFKRSKYSHRHNKNRDKFY